MILTQPHQIEAFRLLAIKGRLELELKGIKFRGGSTFAYVKRTFPLTGRLARRKWVLEAYIRYLQQRGVLPCQASSLTS
jgi:hypothetical protein